MYQLLRTKWAAVGAAVAVTLGAGGLSMAQAAITEGDKPVFVALDAPCRLVDTRVDSNVGAKDTVLAAGETNAYEIQVTGSTVPTPGAATLATIGGLLCLRRRRSK